MRIRLRVHSHGSNTHATRACRNTAGYFTSIGDEDFRKHQGQLLGKGFQK
jgi:hypothetical protein